MENQDLKKIAENYKSDKIEHGYIEIYENYFQELRENNLTILELGVADGKSLLTWSDYFKNSKIVGIDIHKINLEEKNLNKDNIEVHEGSQSDENFISDVMRFLDNVLDDFIENAPEQFSNATYSAMRERSVGLVVM